MYNFNIQFQCVGLILVIMLLILSASRKNLHLITDRAFSILLNMVCLSLVFDILSIFTINFSLMVGSSINLAVCKLYIITLVGVAACTLFYTLTEIYSGGIFRKKLLLIYLIPAAVAIPGICFTELDCHLDRTAIYSYGPSTNIGSAAVTLYLGTAIVYLCIFGKKMNARRRNSIALFAIALLGTGLFQNFNRRFLVAGIAMAVAIIYIYLTLENPDDYLDHITGAFNSGAFIRYVMGMSLENKKISIIGINFSGYKFVQDIYGDKIFAKLLKQLITYFESFSQGRVFYMGEADFRLVLPGDEGFANNVQKIRQDFMNEWTIDDVDVELPASVVAFPADRMDSNYELTLNIFEHFMDQVKYDNDVNYIFIDTKELRDKETNDRVERLLADAIAADGIEAYYQPIYDIQTGRICAAEALARIKDSNGDVILNDDLLPIVEKSGMILKIGMRAFENVCRFMRDTDTQELGIERIGINLSAVQCMQRDMADRLIEIMNKYGVPGSAFTFEITDNSAQYSRDTLLRNMNRLVANGSEFAMDRFGKKYNGIIDLVEVPVTAVKLDRSTIRYCFTNQNPQIMEAGEFMVKVIMQMDRRVVAVGVETEEEYAKLKHLGIRYMQGNYFMGPVGERAFADTCLMLKKN